MVRWSVLAAGAAVVVGAAFVTGASIPPKSGGTDKADEARGTFVGQKIGFFNMARVMRDYKHAQVSIARVNEGAKRAQAQVTGMREMYLALQKKHELTEDAEQKFRLGTELRALDRMIEDFDREDVKKRHALATVLISQFYDEVHAATAVMARARGLHAVLAYSDATTDEENENPAVKELKLKPPAAFPLYLDPSVDYTDELVQRLNAKFAAGPEK